MGLEIYKKMQIESELQKLIDVGKSRYDAAFILMNGENLEESNYLIDAYLMPLDEIKYEIERYDSSNPRIDEIIFVNELSRKYSVDKKSIIRRIQDVRKLIKQSLLDTPERLEKLKSKRDLLQKEKDKLSSSKTMDAEEKSMYYFGLGVVTVVGGFLFYSVSPILVGVIPVVYAAGLPTIRTGIIIKKEHQLLNQLVDLGKEIEYLDVKLNNEGCCDLKSKEFTIYDMNQDINMHNGYIVDEFDILELKSEDNDIKAASGPQLVKKRK